MAYKIMLDAGHGGRDPGAVYNGRQEKDDALALVLAVGQILEDRGLDVEYTRTTDVYESPYEKAMEANESGADFFVSIHRNSNPTPNSASGVETLVYNKDGIKYEMAQAINQNMETLGFRNLGVKERPNLVVLKRTKMPALLVEAGFINSDTDNELLDDNINAVAQAIADGILQPLGISADGVGGRADYAVQTGAFRNRNYAMNLLNELLEEEYPAYLEEGNGLYRVLVGSYETLDEAAAMERRLKQDGFQTVIVNVAQ